MLRQCTLAKIAIESQSDCVVLRVDSNMRSWTSPPDSRRSGECVGPDIRGAIAALEQAGTHMREELDSHLEKAIGAVASIGDRAPRQSGSSLFADEPLR